MIPTLRPARFGEHADVMKIAKTTKWTRDFSNHMFSSEWHYNKGWVLVAAAANCAKSFTDVPAGTIVGFVSLRQMTRRPETNVYFVGVAPEHRSQGIGESLIRKVLYDSPHGKIGLKVALDNERAKKFYDRLGFVVRETDEQYWHMELKR